MLAAVSIGLLILFCPKPTLYGDIGFSTAIYDSDGALLRLTLASDDRYRLRSSLADSAKIFQRATLLYEDRHFHSHPGFNPAALLRAAWTTYVQRQRVVGGSTITMQLARLRFRLNTRSVGGKLQQIFRAVQLERHYSKDEILEAYLNLAPYGGNIEGIATASLIYFSKAARNLNLSESLALAVIAQNPARRNPGSRQGYSEMIAARDRLQKLWDDEYGLNDDEQALLELPLRVRSSREMPFLAPHFVQEVLSGKKMDHGSFHTTLDLMLQQELESQIDRYLEKRQAVGIDNASALLIDYTTMNVLAAVGSANFFDNRIQGQVNGTAAKRSPGSTLKPFVYGMALDNGTIHPMSLLKDAPTRFAAYTPENFDRGFLGPIVARDALIFSRNVPAINLLSQIGHDKFHDFLTRTGVSELRTADHYGLAMVLGGNELTMKELVSLYAMLANGGAMRPLRNNKDAKEHHIGNRVLSREASFLVLDMLRNNPRPDAIAIHSSANEQIAWKTGTSYAYRDAWSIGVFDHYVLAVWVGHFDGRSNSALVGREAAAPLFFAIADTLRNEASLQIDTNEPPASLNVRQIDVCEKTGDLPGQHCPQTVKSWFIPGVSPIRVSTVHRAIAIDNISGLRACHHDPETTSNVIYEFWPSDILRVYRSAGIAIRQPPRWNDDCSLASAICWWCPTEYHISLLAVDLLRSYAERNIQHAAINRNCR